MARSASLDPLEKFRFTVKVISLDLSITGLADAAGLIDRRISVVSRAGFKEVALPKADINTIVYRENVDNQRFSKGPGLVKYEPVTLRRGVTENKDLYEWYRLVNNDMALLGAAQELTGRTLAPVQNENFRKEVIISVLDREGNEVKQWMLFNAFPISYKGGNDLDSQTDEKLIEELTLDYEFFLELEGGIGGFAKELVKDLAEGTIITGLDALGAKTKLPFIK
jgi:phage tail-like protein